MTNSNKITKKGEYMRY